MFYYSVICRNIGHKALIPSILLKDFLNILEKNPRRQNKQNNNKKHPT